MDFEGMKVLDIGPLFFKLPDDFTGSFSDALCLFADYHDTIVPSKREHPKEEVTEDSKAYIAERKKRWASFIEGVKRGKRVHGQMSTVVVTSGKAVVEKLKGDGDG